MGVRTNNQNGPSRIDMIVCVRNHQEEHQRQVDDLPNWLPSGDFDVVISGRSWDVAESVSRQLMTTSPILTPNLNAQLGPTLQAWRGEGERIIKSHNFDMLLSIRPVT